MRASALTATMPMPLFAPVHPALIGHLAPPRPKPQSRLGRWLLKLLYRLNR